MKLLDPSVKTPFLGAAYYPEDWDEADMPHDIEMMLKAGVSVARMAEFAWHKMEPREGEYDFAWLHKVVEALADAGITSMLGTPTATPPRWLLKKYPQIPMLNADTGVRSSHGGRRHCCANNPDYLAYSYKIVEEMSKSFAGDPNVIAWQIDNEIYYNDCVCPHCMEAFHKWLEAKYGTIDELNRRWNLNIFSQWYDSFDDVPPAKNAWHNPHLNFDWKAFQYESSMKFVHKQAEIMRGCGIDVPIGTDMMPMLQLDHAAVNEPLDLPMFNHYNPDKTIYLDVLMFDFFRNLGSSGTFVNTETATCWNGGTHTQQMMKPEGFCRINSWLPIACGAKGNMYWLWRQHWAGHELIHGSVISAQGRPLHIFKEVQQVAAEYDKAAEVLNKTRVSTPLAVMWTSHNARLFDEQCLYWGYSYYMTVADLIYRPISKAGMRPDMITAKTDLSAYKILFLPCMMTLEEEPTLRARVEEWVKAGGTLVIGPMSDIRDDIGAHHRKSMTTMLERLTGGDLMYSIPDDGTHLTTQWADGTPFAGKGWFEVWNVPEGGESIVNVTGTHSELVGRSTAFRVAVGRGTVFVLGGIPAVSDMVKLLPMVCSAAGVAMPEVTGELVAAPRKGTDGTEALVLIETAHAQATYKIDRPMTDVLTGTRYEGTVELKPYDVLVLS